MGHEGAKLLAPVYYKRARPRSRSAAPGTAPAHGRAGRGASTQADAGVPPRAPRGQNQAMGNLRPARTAIAALLLACLGLLPAPAAAPAYPVAPAWPGGPAATAAAGWSGDITAADGYVPAWSWPLRPLHRVLTPFRPPPQPWLTGHRGVDLSAAAAATVAAPAAGTVAFAGWVVDRPVLTIDHGSGLRSSFEPVASDLRKGDAVARGDPVGRLSGRGHCAGPCVHWGVRRGGQYVNPLQFVTDLRPSVLLPLPPAG
jgi:murein DD-endopeptidase MepM/ murein hydrolase activator NlpD